MQAFSFEACCLGADAQGPAHKCIFVETGFEIEVAEKCGSKQQYDLDCVLPAKDMGAAANGATLLDGFAQVLRQGFESAGPTLTKSRDAGSWCRLKNRIIIDLHKIKTRDLEACQREALRL